jgi:hypothetical protein
MTAVAPPKHACVDCAALPVDDQPDRPRSAPHGGPRSRRCETHQRVFKRGQKRRARHAYAKRTYGIEPEELDALWKFQGERCVCGRRPTRFPDTDHDHDCCDGPTSCGKCVRMLLCRACNKDVVGRYSAEQLRALADAIDDPPLQRMRRSLIREAS